MLEKLLKNNIQILEKIDTWEESIKIASVPLLEKNVIKSSYIEAMIDSIKKIGFYVVLREDLAMPHARPEEGVLETGVSFLKLNNAVNFGENKVQLIFILAAKDSESHINIIMELSDLFQDDDRIEALKASRSIEEIENIIGNK